MFGRHREEGFGGIAVALALKQAFAEPILRIRLQAQGAYGWPKLEVPLRVDAAATVGRIGLLPGSTIPLGGAR